MNTKKVKKAFSDYLLKGAVKKLASDEKVFNHFQDISNHFNSQKNAWPLGFALYVTMSGLESDEYQLLLRYMGYRLMIDRNTGLLVILRGKK